MKKYTENNPKRTNRKKTKIGCLILIVLFFIGMCNTKSGEDNSSNSLTSEKKEKEVPENALNGIMPVDIYLNYEKIGFKTKHSYNPEAGHLWTCTRRNLGIEETITISSGSATYVEDARVLVQLDPRLKEPEAALSSLQFMVTIPFEGNSEDKCRELQQWIIDNLYNDKAENTCGDVKFTIHAPTNMVRMLTVVKKY